MKRRSFITILAAGVGAVIFTPLLILPSKPHMPVNRPGQYVAVDYVGCGACDFGARIIGMDEKGLPDVKCPGCDTIGSMEETK